MDRRQFPGGGVGVLVTANSSSRVSGVTPEGLPRSLTSPEDTVLKVLPVMTNIIHTGIREGPCRWRVISVDQEKALAKSSLCYKLGRFTSSGWENKVVVDFTQNHQKRVPVASIDPTASKLLIPKGELVESDGWDGEDLGCSHTVRMRPLNGSSEDYARKQPG